MRMHMHTPEEWAAAEPLKDVADLSENVWTIPLLSLRELLLHVVRGRLVAPARDTAQERAQIVRQLAPHVDRDGRPERVREREARHVQERPR